MTTAERIKAARVVAIGASAGGVEALRNIFRSITSPPPFAIITVLHVPATEKSLLPELFGGFLDIPVLEPDDKDAVEPGKLYFASPSYHLMVERDFTFSFSLDAPENFSRPSIDILFGSVADAYGPGAVGILLTGANRDGATGLGRIIDRGGLGIVQTPETALAPEMPLAAIAQNPQAIPLPLGEICALLGTR